MAAPEIDRLIQMMARLPGLGPRSARRAVLHLISKKETALSPLTRALEQLERSVGVCSSCGNIDASDPCAICRDHRRDQSLICVVEDVADLWALERAGSYRGLYHVLGGTLSAIDGIGPEDLGLDRLYERSRSDSVQEIILATSATMDGQTTAHYIHDTLKDCAVKITALAHGVPVGGELDYLDDGTLSTALNARRPL